MKQRDISLDVIRCLACIMVVSMHSPMPDIGTPGIVLSAISFLNAPCIGLFLMVSGALLIPMKDDAMIFLTRRFTKIAYPTIFWSLFYITVNYVSGTKTFDIQSLARQIASLPFSVQGQGVMWFMYTIAGIYLVVPIISPWIRTASKRQIQFYIALWLVTMCYPLLKVFVNIDDTNTGVLYYFSGYIGYFVLGYYLRHHQSKRMTRFLLIILLLIPIVIAALCKLAHIKVDFYEQFWYLSIFTVMMCVAWFSIVSQNEFVNKIDGKLGLFIIKFSNCSFGVYLIHIFIMRNILWKCGALNWWSQIVITPILTLVISYLLVEIIAKLPFANYIIGYKS